MNFRELSLLTDKLNGAEIKAICTEAGMFAIRNRKPMVTMNDFLIVIPKIRNKMNERPLIDVTGNYS